MSPLQKTKRPRRVLIVDDDPADLELARLALSDGWAGVEIFESRGGDDALDFLHQRGPHAAAPRPDLVLLDLNMPGTDGHHVLREIKNDTSLADMPVAILSTSSNPDDIQTSYRNHANCYVVKPTAFDGLAEVARRIEDFWFSVVELPSAGTA